MRAVRYSLDGDALLIELSDELIDHAEHCGQVIVHVSAKDTPIMVEILEATAFVRDALRAMIDASLDMPKLELSVEMHKYDVMNKLMDDLKVHVTYAQQARHTAS